MFKCMTKNNKKEELDTLIHELVELIELNNTTNEKINIIINKIKKFKISYKQIYTYESDMNRYNTPIKLYEVLHYSDNTTKHIKLRNRGISAPEKLEFDVINEEIV